MSEPQELWEFEAPIEYHDFGRMGYTVVYLPERIKQQLPFDKYPRLRVNADVSGVPITGAFQPGQGKTYLIVSKAMLKTIGAQLGDTVDVQFTVADQDAVDVPDELRARLRVDTSAAKAWEQLTPGKQRAHCHSIKTAKTQPTIEKRVKAVLLSLQQDD